MRRWRGQVVGLRSLAADSEVLWSSVAVSERSDKPGDQIARFLERIDRSVAPGSLPGFSSRGLRCPERVRIICIGHDE